MEKTGVGSYVVDKKSEATGAVFFVKSKDLGITVPNWQVLRMSDVRMISMQDT